MTYNILTGTKETLPEAVNSMLEAGWELYGPPLVLRDKYLDEVFAQAVTKETEYISYEYELEEMTIQ